MGLRKESLFVLTLMKELDSKLSLESEFYQKLVQIDYEVETGKKNILDRDHYLAQKVGLARLAAYDLMDEWFSSTSKSRLMSRRRFHRYLDRAQQFILIEARAAAVSQSADFTPVNIQNGFMKDASRIGIEKVSPVRSDVYSRWGD